tara:strand:+ start:68 stop:361 length:294 start_codon:yes stop_codon:yes gene_type:complete
MSISKRYDKVNITKLENGKYKGIIKRDTKYYKKVPESESDVWVMTQDGDRLDLLADQYYGDSQLWWFIARANNLKSNNIPMGTTLRIPANLESINVD